MKITEITCQACKNDPLRAAFYLPAPGVLPGCEPDGHHVWYACHEHRTPEHRELDLSVDTAPICEQCGSSVGVRWAPSMTAYHNSLSSWKFLRHGEEGPPDLNRDRALCPICFKEHVEYWTEMWDEYNRGRL